MQSLRQWLLMNKHFVQVGKLDVEAFAYRHPEEASRYRLTHRTPRVFKVKCNLTLLETTGGTGETMTKRH